MTDDLYAFQYCQKIVVFSKDKTKLLLAKRVAEADYDGTFALIGGKMEVTDKSIIEGLKREKDEEVGPEFKIRVHPQSGHNLLWRKKDGQAMILPHFLAYHESGELKLNPGEYSEHKWVPLDELKDFEPKIESIPAVVAWALDFAKTAKDSDFIEI